MIGPIPTRWWSGARASSAAAKRLLSVSVALGACVAFSPSLAANTTSFVSSTGSDTNACTRTAPCATLQGAFSKTDAAGEIDCVDPADYGGLDITRSVTINCVGAHARTRAIRIESTGPAFNVVLDGLDVNGTQGNGGGDSEGLDVQGVGGHVAVRHSKVQGLLTAILVTTSGDTTIDFEDVDLDDSDKSGFFETAGLLVDGSGTVRIDIRNSRIMNGGTGSFGIGVDRSGSAFLTMDGSEISHSETGLLQRSGSLVLNVRNSRIFGTRVNGVRLTSAAQAVFDNDEISGGSNGIVLFSGTANGNPAITAMIRGTTISNNGNYGIVAAGAGARSVVTRSTIARNGTGVSAQSGAAIYSAGNNNLSLNAANGTLTGTVSQQ